VVESAILLAASRGNASQVLREAATAYMQKNHRAMRTFEIVTYVSNRHVGMRIRHLLALFAGGAIQLAKGPVQFLRGVFQATAAV